MKLLVHIDCITGNFITFAIAIAVLLIHIKQFHYTKIMKINGSLYN